MLGTLTMIFAALVGMIVVKPMTLAIGRVHPETRKFGRAMVWAWYVMGTIMLLIAAVDIVWRIRHHVWTWDWN